MPKLLHLSSSTRNCSVAISDGNQLVSLCEEATDGYQHAEKLHLFVQWALESTPFSLQDLDGIVIDKGPGSYTGLRIGVSAAKGFCFGLNIPLLSLDSLDILAQASPQQFDAIVPLLDARRNEVYCCVYDQNKVPLQAIEAKILDDSSFANLRDKKVCFLGDGAAKAKELLKFPEATYLPESFPSAQYMLNKALQKWNEKAVEDVAYFEPFYLKEFQGTPPKKQRNA